MAQILTGRKKEPPEIPVASFSDIAFLLIIFFIVATRIVQNTGVITEVPSGEKTQSAPTKTPTIQLHEDKIVFNERKVDLKQLKRELEALKLHEQKGEKKVVLLEASGKVPYQTYFDVMCMISRAGGVIALASEEEEKKK